jgi:RNA-directed DNA polymerase
MRTEKSRLRRSLMSLQELMRQIRHHTISDQVGEINAFLRGHYALCVPKTLSELMT